MIATEISEVLASTFPSWSGQMNRNKNRCTAEDPNKMSASLRLYFLGELEGEMQNVVEAHLVECPQCSAGTISLLGADPQDDVTRYEILEVLGKGGSAVVFKVRDLLENRTVAMKVFHMRAQEKAFGENTRHLEMQEKKIAGVA